MSGLPEPYRAGGSSHQWRAPGRRLRQALTDDGHFLAESGGEIPIPSNAQPPGKSPRTSRRSTGAKVSKDTISRITEKVAGELAEWSARPLDPIYPVLFVDAVVVKVRDGWYQTSTTPPRKHA